MLWVTLPESRTNCLPKADRGKDPPLTTPQVECEVPCLVLGGTRHRPTPTPGHIGHFGIAKEVLFPAKTEGGANRSLRGSNSCLVDSEAIVAKRHQIQGASNSNDEGGKDEHSGPERRPEKRGRQHQEDDGTREPPRQREAQEESPVMPVEPSFGYLKDHV